MGVDHHYTMFAYCKCICVCMLACTYLCMQITNHGKETEEKENASCAGEMKTPQEAYK